LPRFEFESKKFWLFYLYPSCMEIRVCLSRGVQVIGVTWRAAMRIMARVGEIVQRTGDGHHRSGTQCPHDREVG
jgi:hypothetical protein